ncbi:MAG: hypothetical protein GX620_00120 [Chloroflexi bacterium]|nr:hypothetical protein [Chloroflexota bacterium]
MTPTPKHRNKVFIAAALLVILAVAAYLRLYGLNWDEGEWIHPDEGHMRMVNAVIQFPSEPAVYFDTHRSPLNSLNSGMPYSYGTLPLFATRLTGELMNRACESPTQGLGWAVTEFLLGGDASQCAPGTFTGSRSAVVGRALSALADLGTVLLVFFIGRRLLGDLAGVVASGLAAFTAFTIQQAHFFTVDSIACFFTTAVALFSLRASHTGAWRDFILAGLMVGLAAGCKIDGVFSAMLVALAAAKYLFDERAARWAQRAPTILGSLVLAGILAFAAFRSVQPYAFEGPGFFGIRPNPEWFGRLRQIVAEQSGELDYPSGRQWTDRAPIVFSWMNMVVWGMGLPLGLAAWAGWAVSGYRLLRGDRTYLVLWVYTTAIFVYQSTRWVKAMRYMLSLYPLFVVFAVLLLVTLAVRATRRWQRWVVIAVSGVVGAGAIMWSVAIFSIYQRPHTRLAASRWIYENVPEGSTVANEHWDWGLPLRIDGHNPFSGMYHGIEMENYNEDTVQKREQLIGWLDEADYVFLASNRLYASIPRIPARYPLTTLYYRSLFNGTLGFELVGDFTSYPAIGPFLFPDQENPFPMVEPRYRSQSVPFRISLPAAEEAFGVYDHPRVLIFRKTHAYSHERARDLFWSVDVDRALHGLKAVDASAAPGMLEFDEQVWADQRAGGTWAEMFSRDSLLNRYPALAAVAWWAVVLGLGWISVPIAFVALPDLVDRGYGLSKTLGVLLLAYGTWLCASARVLPNTRGTIVRILILLVAVGLGVGWMKRRELAAYVRERWRTIVLTELCFAGLYSAWLVIRLVNPDLWHPVVGGEKPMDFAYFNAVLKTTWFPAYNPWYAGSYVNYYYFGFVIVGTLTKLVGTVPSVAYNLAIPTLYALTGVGAFSVAYNLAHGSIRAGLSSLGFAVLLGNLGVVRLVRNGLIRLGGGLPFPSRIPGFAETVAALRGLWQIIAHGARLTFRPESWYWDPTRIIPATPGEAGPITEFPAFTFLYADLHAHMIALPITLLALGCAVQWVRTHRVHWSSYAVGALAIGALRPTNTWDYPTYLVLGCAAILLSSLTKRPNSVRLWPSLKSALLSCGALVLMTSVLFLPYTRHYAPGYTSVDLWRGSRTPFDIYLWMWGILLAPIVTQLVLEIKDAGRQWSRRSLLTQLLLALVIASCGLVALLTVNGGPPPISALVIPLGIACAWLVVSHDRLADRRLMWFAVGSGLALTLMVELIVLRGDIGRMNTVFKFYLQVWVLLSVAGGVCLAAIADRSPGWRWDRAALWWGGIALLIAGGALFIPMGVRARAIDRISNRTGLTLDGAAFMEHSEVFDGDPSRDAIPIPLHGDHLAIRWLQDNVIGSPVIIEGLGHREYLWANRVSIYTGLPTVIGWRWHQVQQRAALPEAMVQWRRDDVREFYSTLSVPKAVQILERYEVKYVYLGAYERAYYDPLGLGKFDDMVDRGILQLVYDAEEVRIYEFRS